MISRAPGEVKGEDLRAAEVRLARIFNSTPVAIAEVDADGALLRPNAAFARLAPGALKAAGGRRHRSSAASPSATTPTCAASSPPPPSARPGSSRSTSRSRARAGRSARLFVSAADPASDEGASAIVFALDTTEQRTLQENFAQGQKMQAIGQLAGGVAHDFNNVLTAIIGYSDLLLANHRPTDPSFQDIMQIKQNANRAAGLVRQLLAFSRRQTLRPQTLQLDDVLSELQMLLRRLVGEPIELDVVHGRDLWLVKADLNQFEQVDRQSGRQRARRDARGRQDHAAHAQRPGGGMRELQRAGAAARRLRAGRGRRTPGTAFPPTCATRSSSRSSPPRRSARAPGSASRWSTASSSRPAATCSATASRARARPSASCCRAISPRPRSRRRSRRRPPSPRPI